MADLEDLGLIAAPHTSAGRRRRRRACGFSSTPCWRSARSTNANAGRSPSRSRAAAQGQVEDLLTEASQLLSGLSQGAGVVIAAKADMVLRHIEFVRLDADPGHGDAGGRGRAGGKPHLPLPPGLTASALTQASATTWRIMWWAHHCRSAQGAGRSAPSNGPSSTN
jgi:heat-inducible transcriptional repressor